jgi:hypothetical protein
MPVDSDAYYSLAVAETPPLCCTVNNIQKQYRKTREPGLGEASWGRFARCCRRRKRQFGINKTKSRSHYAREPAKEPAARRLDYRG